MTAKRDNATDRERRIYAFFSLALLILAASSAGFINFPPGDSWTHAWTVQQWLKGSFVLNQWASTAAFPQQVLGWLIQAGAREVNFSRLSVLTATVTVAGCLLAARLPSRLFPEWPQLKVLSPLLAISALAAPFTLKAAAGFMTDGYYLFFMTCALWFLISALGENSGKSARWLRRWIGFSAFATLAALQRTHGLVLFLIPVLWMFFANPSGNDIKHSIEKRVALICLFTGFLLSLFLLMSPQLSTVRAREVQQEMLSFWAPGAAGFSSLTNDRLRLVFGILHHFGFALLPVTLLTVFVRSSMPAGERYRSASGLLLPLSLFVFVTATVVLFLFRGSLFPYLGNSITDHGFGPRSDTIAATADRAYLLPYRLLLTVLGTFGGMALLVVVFKATRLRGIDWRSPEALVGLLGIAHAALVFVNPNFFDRYLIPLIPFTFCWMAPFLREVRPKLRAASWAIAAALLAWAAWGTADYLDWTKAKWDLAGELRARGVPATEMVAGYEPDGFYTFSNSGYPNPFISSHRTAAPRTGFWWIDRLGLPIEPLFAIVERGAGSGNCPAGWSSTGLTNDRMEVWAAPGIELPH